MNNEMSRTENENNKNGYKTATLVFALLFAGALATTVWFINENNNKETYANNLSSEIEGLNETKGALTTNLTELQGEYDVQIASIDTLQLNLKEKVKAVEELQWRIGEAKKQLASSQKNEEAFRTKLAQLEDLKVSLESDMAMLSEENGALKETNKYLQTSLANNATTIEQLNEEMAVMTADNNKLQQRLYTIAPAGFKAENFTVVAERRNDKITSKAKQADEVKVSFDLDNVPMDHQGKRDIYLVLTEFNGNDVASVPSRKVSVKASDSPISVSAVDIETMNLKGRQSVTMSFTPDDKLAPGTYNVLVYADNGFLGSTGMRLR